MLTTTQIMDESGLHCARMFSPSSSIDSGGLRWLMMGTHGFTYLNDVWNEVSTSAVDLVNTNTNIIKIAINM